MADSPSHAALRRHIERLSPSRDGAPVGVAATGHEDIDRVLGGGIARGKLHEIAAPDAGDAASAAGFAAMCGQRIGGAIGWLRVDRTDRALDPVGLRELGIDTDRLLLIQVPDPPALLRAAGEALRCAAFGAVVIELWGEARRVDLTASRRLVLNAEGSGVTALLLRLAVEPVPSAAQTRWTVGSAPSVPMAADAPGPPVLDLELLRQRGGRAGMRWRVEWDRDGRCFRTPVSGGVVAVPAGGSLADVAGGRRRAG